MLLAAWGLDRVIRWAVGSPGTIALAVGVAAGALFFAMGSERAGYLKDNTAMGLANLDSYRQDRVRLDTTLVDVHRILKERPARAYAGPAATWAAPSASAQPICMISCHSGTWTRPASSTIRSR